jgi:hypothetical protein
MFAALTDALGLLVGDKPTSNPRESSRRKNIGVNWRRLADRF